MHRKLSTVLHVICIKPFVRVYWIGSAFVLTKQQNNIKETRWDSGQSLTTCAENTKLNEKKSFFLLLFLSSFTYFVLLTFLGFLLTLRPPTTPRLWSLILICLCVCLFVCVYLRGCLYEIVSWFPVSMLHVCLSCLPGWYQYAHCLHGCMTLL